VEVHIINLIIIIIRQHGLLHHQATSFRYHYTSLVTPKQTIDFDLATGAKTVLKQVRPRAWMDGWMID